MLKSHRIVAGILTALFAGSLTACSNGGSGSTVATINGAAINKADLDNKLEGGPAAKGVLSSMAQSMLL